MEYLLLIVEFFIIKGKRAFFYYVLLPICLGLLIYFCSDKINYETNSTNFHTNIITVIGIIIGFTMSMFVMFLTIDNHNLDKAKSKLLDKKLYGKNVSLYDSVLVGLAYAILILGFLIIANFIYPIFIPIKSSGGKVLFSINISIAVHAILILMRNILDFYFIISKKSDAT
jgi:hypothetical protein